jgi:hypothetical protein
MSKNVPILHNTMDVVSAAIFQFSGKQVKCFLIIREFPEK